MIDVITDKSNELIKNPLVYINRMEGFKHHNSKWSGMVTDVNDDGSCVVDLGFMNMFRVGYKIWIKQDEQSEPETAMIARVYEK